jgi:hypothetical protein
MKKLLFIAITMISFNSFATSYCHDSAVFAVSDAQKAVAECNTAFPLDAYSKVINKLDSKNPIGYSRRIIRAMKNLRKNYNEGIYEYGLSKVERRCVALAEHKHNQKMNSEVLDAIINCTM